MLSFVCFKWKRNKQGFQLPSDTDYGANHVNIMYAMLKRNISVPFTLTCVTDDQAGIREDVRIVPLWDKCMHLGGCFNRLWVFSKEAEMVLGEKFICIDLDAVIVSDCTELFTRDDDFIINSYKPLYPGRNDQRYNGALFMLKAGSRASVWDSFDQEKTPEIIFSDNSVIGTDQAWIRLHCGPDEKTYTEFDGVYEARQVGATLPNGAKIVFFAGKRDPSASKIEWVRKHWRL